MLLGDIEDDGAEPAHFGLELPGGRGWQKALQAIAAYKFCEMPSRVGGRRLRGTHFHQANPKAPLSKRPRGFYASESGANRNPITHAGCHCHSAAV